MHDSYSAVNSALGPGQGQALASAKASAFGQQLANQLAGSAAMSRPTIAGASERFLSSVDHAGRILADLSAIVGQITGEPAGLTDQSSPKAPGKPSTVAELHGAADGISYALGDIERLIDRLKAAHG